MKIRIALGYEFGRLLVYYVVMKTTCSVCIYR